VNFCYLGRRRGGIPRGVCAQGARRKRNVRADADPKPEPSMPMPNPTPPSGVAPPRRECDRGTPILGSKEAADLVVAHRWRPADVLGNEPLTPGGEDNFLDFASWLTARQRSPREIRFAIEECLWLVAWNDETSVGGGRSRSWRQLMREILG
jgi:hypothetical protein